MGILLVSCPPDVSPSQWHFFLPFLLLLLTLAVLANMRSRPILMGFPNEVRDRTSGILLPPEKEYSYPCHRLWLHPSAVTQRVTAEVRSRLSRPQLQLFLFFETGDFAHHFLMRLFSGSSLE